MPVNRKEPLRSHLRTTRGATKSFGAGVRGTSGRHIDGRCHKYQRLVHWFMRIRMVFDIREDALDWTERWKMAAREEHFSPRLSWFLLERF
jgi:hypothetical protein